MHNVVTNEQHTLLQTGRPNVKPRSRTSCPIVRNKLPGTHIVRGLDATHPPLLCRQMRTYELREKRAEADYMEKGSDSDWIEEEAAALEDSSSDSDSDSDSEFRRSNS